MSPSTRSRARLAAAVVLATAASALAVSATTTTSTAASTATSTATRDDSRLYLVTLRGPGTAADRQHGLVADLLARTGMLARQSRVLAEAGAQAPVYRWTTALDGFAVDLTPSQAAAMTRDRSVVSVEPDEVRRLAGLPDARDHRHHRARHGAHHRSEEDRPGVAADGIGLDGPRRGGAGEVIGLVDTGIAPESPLFAQVRGGTLTPPGFTCDSGDGWAASDCNGKIVAAHYYVAGFGADALTSASSLSPRDTDGHGTQLASIAAGNSGVPVHISGESLGRYGGMAPQAQIAVYKACWSAPDPDDDGCSTADLVSAIDRATADGVDVLSLAVAGPDRIDTVERALLGAAESGTVVTAAAGNDGARSYAAHPSPWVTTVGATTDEKPQGRVLLGQRGPRLTGAMLSRRGVGKHRIVLAAQVPARGATREQARYCTPGSLDAARVSGAIVVCLRGRVGRVDKSQAVSLADGTAMVLVNRAPGSIDADVQSVPTVHLAQAQGRHLVHYVRQHPGVRVRLRALAPQRARPRVAEWSSPGDARAQVLKPDVVAPGSGLLGAVPGAGDDGWDFVSGSSAATAYTSGVAATLLSRTGWGPSRVRSALATSAAPLGRTALLRAGSGRLRPASAARPGLAYLVSPHAYREWLDGHRPQLNTASVLLEDGTTTVARTVTNVTHRRLYFSSSARGFRSDVTVTPAALRLGPGEHARITIHLNGGLRGHRVDDGYVVWRGATGTVTRLPVVIAR